MIEKATVLDAWERVNVHVLQSQWALPELHVFDSVSSTNDVVKARGEAGASAGACAIAELQTRGRGRRDRKWDAPPGTALLMSMLFRPAPPSPADLAGTTPLRVGMAVARAIEQATRIDVALKWPNDILARDGRKIAGVLCESSMTSSGVAYTVVGVGINVLQGRDALHRDDRNAAASLRVLAEEQAAGAAHISRLDVATAVITELRALAQRPLAPLGTSELAEYAARDILAHHAITADDDPVGTADGVGPSGDLRVREGSKVRSIHAGTIRMMQ